MKKYKNEKWIKIYKFKFHRGGFKDSMQTEIEVDSFDKLFKIISKAMPILKIKKSDIEIKEQCAFDPKIGVTDLVLSKKLGTIGFLY